jgi:hypothetical protein
MIFLRKISPFPQTPYTTLHTPAPSTVHCMCCAMILLWKMCAASCAVGHHQFQRAPPGRPPRSSPDRENHCFPSCTIAPHAHTRQPLNPNLPPLPLQTRPLPPPLPQPAPSLRHLPLPGLPPRCLPMPPPCPLSLCPRKITNPRCHRAPAPDLALDPVPLRQPRAGNKPFRAS